MMYFAAVGIAAAVWAQRSPYVGQDACHNLVLNTTEGAVAFSPFPVYTCCQFFSFCLDSDAIAPCPRGWNGLLCGAACGVGSSVYTNGININREVRPSISSIVPRSTQMSPT